LSFIEVRDLIVAFGQKNFVAIMPTPMPRNRPVGLFERNLAFFSTQQKSLFAEFFRAAHVVAPLRRACNPSMRGWRA
jgi:hypothetical protein